MRIRTDSGAGRRAALRHLPAILALLLFAVTLQAQSPPYGLTERVPNTDFLIDSGGNLTTMELQRVFAGLSFTRPILLTHAGDGSDRVFVVEQRGVISVFANQPDISSKTTFLDISARTNDRPNEAGLLGVAFHPDYANNGKFYVYYTAGNLISRFSEFRVSASDPDRADSANERVILEIDQPAGNHNGGAIAFGFDGYLYIALGDGGGANDTYGNGQNPRTLLGAILRIDIDRQQNGRGYAVPSDNPFAGNSDGWREEIWAWGLRNPWRMSFDRQTGELWAADVGQGAWEEVNLIKKGGNYGWNIMEGFHCFRSSTCDQTGLELPVVEYDHGQGQSITGGYVYRGPRLARLAGVYLYGDYVSRRIWGLRYEDGQVIENSVLASSPSAIASFGEDQAGEVYVVGHDGRIYRFAERSGNEPPGNIPATISESGLYADIASRTPAPGLIPYSVNAELWSDGAEKIRYLALPGTTQIDFAREGHWQFPASTVLVKNFLLELERGNPASRKLIETRFLVKRRSGEQWDGFSYMWNDEGTDAVLLEGRASKTFTIRDGNRDVEQVYDFPSRTDCLACHTPAAGYVLGVRTAQINKPHDYGEVIDNQLRSYNHIELFTSDIGEDYRDFPQLANPFDSQQPLAARARAYLDANCSQCHQPGSSGRSNMDLRFDAALEQTNVIEVPPLFGDLGIDGAARVLPGEPARSVLLQRMLIRGENQMPPLASNVVDAAGSALIRDWIVALKPTAVDEGATPVAFALQPVYPNPFNPAATLRFSLPRTAEVTLAVYDLLGRRVRILVEQVLPAGAHQVQWLARDEQGQAVAAGLYLFRLQAGDALQVQKALLLK